MEATDKGMTDAHTTPLPRRLAMVGAVDRALALARENLSLHVSLFKTSWTDVDDARQRVHAAGLAERIDARHIDALRAAGPAALSMDWKN